MRRSSQSKAGLPVIPTEALREIEHALEDLALAPRAGIRTRKQYIYIEIDNQRFCRFEYFSQSGNFALDLPRLVGSGYGAQGRAGFYRAHGTASELLSEAFKRHESRATEAKFMRVLLWVATSWWVRAIFFLLLPLILLLQYILLRTLRNAEPTSSAEDT